MDLLQILSNSASSILSPATIGYALAAVRLSRVGALVQQANAVESLSRVDVLCTDKTGTLTEGKPTLVTALAAPGREDTLLSWSAAIQAGSEHPLARAVMNAAEQAGKDDSGQSGH